MQTNLKSVLVSRLVISMRKEVVGFEGLYEVDTGGHVYSILQTNSRRIKELSQYTNEGGYLKVNLYDLNGKCKKKYVHRIVAEAFLKNPKRKPNVNHIDCNRQNNNVDNLEWCTQSENIRHCVRMGRFVSNLPNVKKAGDALCQI